MFGGDWWCSWRGCVGLLVVLTAWMCGSVTSVDVWIC